MKHHNQAVDIVRYTLQIVSVLFFLGGSSATCTACQEAVVDIIIFSYNRPMQLYALLESMQKHIVSARGTTYVIYRCDNENYAQAYNLVHKQFQHALFMKQGDNPAQDFKLLTLQALDASSSPYVMFAVDDIIVTNTINLAECITALEITHAYGFYMRLGTHLTRCYFVDKVQSIPPLQRITESIGAWQFSEAELDWNYPNTVDMTIYRKADIEDTFKNLAYCAPNILEANWHQHGLPSCYKLGLCYTTSRIVNIPYNQVQTMWYLPHMQEHTPQDLLELFMSGKKIAIDDLTGINNTAAHMHYSFRFIESCIT